MVGRTVLEITYDLKAGGRVARQFLVKFGHVAVAAHQYHRARVAALLAVLLQHVSERKAIDGKDDEKGEIKTNEKTRRSGSYVYQCGDADKN